METMIYSLAQNLRKKIKCMKIARNLKYKCWSNPGQKQDIVLINKKEKNMKFCEFCRFSEPRIKNKRNLDK